MIVDLILKGALMNADLSEKDNCDIVGNYMKGNNIDDINDDWRTVGNDIRTSMINFSKR